MTAQLGLFESLDDWLYLAPAVRRATCRAGRCVVTTATGSATAAMAAPTSSSKRRRLGPRVPGCDPLDWHRHHRVVERGLGAEWNLGSVDAFEVLRLRGPRRGGTFVRYDDWFGVMRPRLACPCSRSLRSIRDYHHGRNWYEGMPRAASRRRQGGGTGFARRREPAAEADAGDLVLLADRAQDRHHGRGYHAEPGGSEHDGNVPYTPKTAPRVRRAIAEPTRCSRASTDEQVRATSACASMRTAREVELRGASFVEGPLDRPAVVSRRSELRHAGRRRVPSRGRAGGHASGGPFQSGRAAGIDRHASGGLHQDFTVRVPTDRWQRPISLT